MSNMDQVITTDIFIGGSNRPASNGAVYDLFNPARPTELVGHAAAATRDDVDAAVRAARGDCHVDRRAACAVAGEESRPALLLGFFSFFA